MIQRGEENDTAGEKLKLQILESATADFRDFCWVECESRLRFLPGRRSIWRAVCDGREILLKIFDVHPKQERDIRQEWGNAVKLANADLNTAEPLFLGECNDGRKAVAFSYLADGITLSELLKEGGSPSEDELVKQVIQMHAEQHGIGCYQSDDHLGNYFWSDDQLWMLDAGSFVFSSAPLSDKEREANIAMLAANIPLRLRSQFDAALAENYSLGLPVMNQPIQTAVRKRASEYFKKTRRACSEFEHEREKGANWLACRNLDPALKAKMQQDPDQFFVGEQWLKKGNTASVVALEEGGRSYILKRYNQKSRWYRLLRILSESRALASWSNGHVLRLFGVPTPQPIACLLLRSGILRGNCYLLMEKTEGVSLGVLSKAGVTEKLTTAAQEFTDRCHELEMLQATHGDMKASNFIFDNEGRLQLIDLDSLIFHSNPRSYERKKLKDMERFMRNWQKRPELKKVFKR